MRAVGLLLFSAMFILTSCVVVEDGPRPMPPPPREPGPACTTEYDPVCGERRGVRQTYGNACIASAERARIIHRGECRREGSWRPPEVCTREYAPVCGERRGERRTYPNVCEAERARARIIHDGECRRGRPPEGPITPAPIACPMIYQPVCGRLDGEVRTFGNSCEAGSVGAHIIHEGECRRR